ncbi:hypothetical protein Ocin01_16099 [Orchesella cincta]|uniref:Uncharacterized protein n=1 Tax=Orchesella cincta TaxID=48709 RepID=A0A1D2MC86_ORCCI|nr:hypothetical protein Ocin01_16099 [Orchesella cincta]
MTLNIRTLTRCIWVMVAEKENVSKVIIEKVSVINLLMAFPYATKNYLREQYSYNARDIRELISHIPKFCTPNPSQPLDIQEENPNVTGSWRSRDISRTRVYSINNCSNIKPCDESVSTIIPIELSYYIASYINRVSELKLAEGPTISVMNTALNNLVDCLGGMERILQTPIPPAYSVHLHHATWLYLLALPYQLIGRLNWFTIPAVGLASFCLLGILDIGREIENPFEWDTNDLELDDFCRQIHKEIWTIIGHRMPTPESWLLSSESHHPLAPVSSLTASELITLEETKLREILKKGAIAEGYGETI